MGAFTLVLRPLFQQKNTQNCHLYCKEQNTFKIILFAYIIVGSYTTLVYKYVEEILETLTMQIARYFHLKIRK